MDMGIYLFLFLLLFLFSGVPVALSIGLAVLATVMVWGQIPVAIIFQQFFQGVDSFPLLAIPLFIMAGTIMLHIGLIDDLVDFCNLLVGRLRGGLAYVNVLASVFFASMSGSAVADTASIGSLLIPAMKKNGYDEEFSVAITATSSIIGPIIPPSIAFVIYGSLMGVSTGALFMGGIVPGLMLGGVLCVMVAVISKKKNYPVSTKRYTRKEARRICGRAIPAALLPVIILGGIMSGLVSPTEAAALTNIYAIVLGVFVYKTVNCRQLCNIIGVAMATAGAVLLINASAKPLSWLVAMAQIPIKMQAFIFSITDNRLIIMLIVNIFLLFMGCFMECNANILIFGPILAPMLTACGFHPLHIGVMFVLNCVIGTATPPFGPCLFLGASIAKIPIERVIKAIIPLCLAEMVVVLMVAYIPEISLLIPRLLDYV